MADAWLGIDLGTSSVKSLVLDEAGHVAGVGQAAYDVHRPHPTWAEQDPEAWWRATVAATRDALARHPGAAIRGIGLSGQMHGVVLTDASARPTRPAIIWSDARATAEANEWGALLGEDRIEQLTGFRPAAGMAGPVLRWLRRHEPESLDGARFVMQPKDIIRFRLTGLASVEPTDAGASLLFALDAAEAHPDLLSAAGIDGALIPPCVPTLEAAGELSPSAAEALGIAAGTPVAAGGGDQAMAALGLGLEASNRAAISLSSGGTTVVPVGSDGVPRGIHRLASATPGRELAMGVVLAAGLAVDWVARITGTPAGTLLAQAADADLTGGLMALADLGGTRTPVVDGSPQGAFAGLGFHHDGSHLTRAVVESAAVSLADALHALDPDQTTAVVLSGGGARYAVWRQAAADAVGRPVLISSDLEHSAIGAALAGAAASGGDVRFDVRDRVLAAPVRPDEAGAARLRELRVRRTALRALGRPHRAAEPCRRTTRTR